MKLGYFLSCEEYGPRELVRQAKLAEGAGFHGLWISDHFHPWNDEQGESPFVWSVIGALAEATTLPVATAVTCPTLRIHPAVMAQAAATSAALLGNGRFAFGVGTGEALNEHILGDHWPEADARLNMLEEAIEIIRELWTGKQVSHDGQHYLVENARIYTLPDELPPIYVSGFGPKAIELAGRIGDGFVTVGPDEDAIRQFRDAGGDGKPVQAGGKVCFGEDEQDCVKTAHRLWPNQGLPGELAQIIPTPAHFEQACELVTEEMIAESTPCGPDLDKHLSYIQAYADAGVDELYIQQIGPNQDEFFRTFGAEIVPKFSD
jgi:G6PDH family F420-dependent oxidoreductase